MIEEKYKAVTRAVTYIAGLIEQDLEPKYAANSALELTKDITNFGHGFNGTDLMIGMQRMVEERDFCAARPLIAEGTRDAVNLFVRLEKPSKKQDAITNAINYTALLIGRGYKPKDAADYIQELQQDNKDPACRFNGIDLMTGMQRMEREDNFCAGGPEIAEGTRQAVALFAKQEKTATFRERLMRDSLKTYPGAANKMFHTEKLAWQSISPEEAVRQ